MPKFIVTVVSAQEEFGNRSGWRAQDGNGKTVFLPTLSPLWGPKIGEVLCVPELESSPINGIPVARWMRYATEADLAVAQ